MLGTVGGHSEGGVAVQEQVGQQGDLVRELHQNVPDLGVSWARGRRGEKGGWRWVRDEGGR